MATQTLTQWLTPRNHPLRFLLGMEWALLLLVMLSCFPVLLPWQTLFPMLAPAPIVTGLNLLCLLGVLITGLALPTVNRRDRVFYLIGLYGLILLPTIWGRLPLFQLLYVVYIARSCLICPVRWRWVLSIGVIATIVLIQVDRSQSWIAPQSPVVMQKLIVGLQIGGITLLALVLLFLQLLITIVLAERQGRAELAQANRKLRTYALQIEDIATLQERNRIAREIHDALGHSLTAFNLHLEGALRLLDRNPVKAKTLLKEAQDLGKATLQDVRRSVTILRTDPLHDRSLAAAVQVLCEDHARSTRTQPTCQFQTLALSPAQTTVVYRMIQEALTNIAKYANATIVTIDLAQQAEQVTLKIQDNGVGFALAQTHMGFGLQGMRERITSLDGQLEIITRPNQGCQIIATFPIALNHH
jgi:signal transduction histidine kinase